MEFPDFIFETLPHQANSSELSSNNNGLPPYIEYQAVRYQHQHNNGMPCYACLLCDRRELTEEAVKYHCQEDSHLQAVLRLKSEKEQARVMLQRWNCIQQIAVEQPQQAQASFVNTNNNRSTMSMTRGSAASSSSSLLETRIDQLGLPAWRDAVQACLFRYLTGSSTDDTEHCLGDAMVAVRKYEHLERISLLELAVWKAACLVEMPADGKSIDYFAATQWLSEGWKSQKEVQRKSNSISIIMSTVVPFLDKPRSTTSSFVYGTTARHPWAATNDAAVAAAVAARNVNNINNRTSAAGQSRLVRRPPGPYVPPTVGAQVRRVRARRPDA